MKKECLPARCGRDTKTTTTSDYTRQSVRYHRTSSVVSDGLGKHRLSTAGRSKHQYTARWVDADLFVQLKVSQRQFNRLTDFLLLDVHTADVRVRDIRLLVCQSNTTHLPGANTTPTNNR